MSRKPNSGAPADIAWARPFMELMGEHILVCGALGAGAMMKLVSNYVSIAINLATAEGMTLAQTGGVNVQTARDVMSLALAGQGHLNTAWPEKVLKDDPSPAFMFDLDYKELGLALETGAKLNVPLATGRATYPAARARGHAPEDWTTGIYRTMQALTKGE